MNAGEEERPVPRTTVRVATEHVTTPVVAHPAPYATEHTAESVTGCATARSAERAATSTVGLGTPDDSAQAASSQHVSTTKTYIATFFSHYGAMQYYRELLRRNIAARPMPVPRSVSASCGTCVRYEHDIPLDLENCELETVYLITTSGYKCVLTG